jgi:hypothetical protein
VCTLHTESLKGDPGAVIGHPPGRQLSGTRGTVASERAIRLGLVPFGEPDRALVLLRSGPAAEAYRRAGLCGLCVARRRGRAAFFADARQESLMLLAKLVEAEIPD